MAETLREVLDRIRAGAEALGPDGADLLSRLEAIEGDLAERRDAVLRREFGAESPEEFLARSGREASRQIARAQEQRLLDQMRNPDA